MVRPPFRRSRPFIPAKIQRVFLFIKYARLAPKIDGKKDPTHPYNVYIGRERPGVRTFLTVSERGMVFAQKKQSLRPPIEGLETMTAGSQVRTSIHILFVCTANICRSFLAERILKKILKVHKIHSIHVASAGLMDMQGAPADLKAARLLHEKGMDATRHRSRHLTQELADWADVILVMEEIHRDEIAVRYPESRDKVHLLGAFSGGRSNGDKNIKDPHGLTDYHYRTCFAEIYLALDGLIKCI